MRFDAIVLLLSTLTSLLGKSSALPAEQPIVSSTEKPTPKPIQPSPKDPIFHPENEPDNDAIGSHAYHNYAAPPYTRPGGHPPPSYPNFGEPIGAFIPAFEGFLVPASALTPKQEHLDPLNSVSKTLQPIGETLLAIVVKVGFTLLSVAAVVVLGGIATSLFCTFTPFCRSGLFGATTGQAKEIVKEISDQMGVEITTERIKRAAEFVTAALEKFEQMQKLVNVEKSD